jgi:hypothetical protein
LTQDFQRPALLISVSELEEARDRDARGDDSKDGNDK